MSNKEKVSMGIRIVLSIILSAIIWIRVDWSVGMFAVFVLFNGEVQSLINKKVSKALRVIRGILEDIIKKYN